MWRLWIPVFLLCSLYPVFVSPSNRCLKNIPEKFPKRFLRVDGIPRNVILETSRRKTHQITTRILKIFLQEVLAYSDVDIMMVNDNFDNGSLVFHRLAGPLYDSKSLMPESMINLEVWSPPDENVVNFIESHYVTDYGINGPPSRFGWFIPTNLSKILPGMDHWRIFSSPETAKYFTLSKTHMDEVQEYIRNSTTMRYYCEDKFCKDGVYTPERCLTSPCATLLSGYADTTGFVKDHINKLELYVQVVWVGPHLQQVVSSLTQRLNKLNTSSLVFLSWTPSIMSIPGDGNHVIVAFPPCETFDRTLKSCKYDLHRIVKLAWSKLKSISYPIYYTLLHVNFSLQDYTDFLYIYRKKTEGIHNGVLEDPDQIVEDIACHWLQTHEYLWKIWDDRANYDNELYIGGIFPLTGSSYVASSIAYAAQMATKAVGKSNILRDYRLKLFSDDGKCQADTVMKVFIGYIMQNHFKQLVGILGPACSDTVEPLAGVSRHYHTLVISYSAEGSSFSDRKKYPYFFRTIGENNQYQQVYLQLLNKLKWTRLGALTEDGHKYTEYLSHLHVLLRKNNITFDFNSKFPPQGKRDIIKQYLQEMMHKNLRIIIGDVYDDAARAVMCTAYHLGMTAKDSYVWFLPAWLSLDWYDTEKYNKKNNESIDCTTEEMIKAINGYFSLSHASYAHDDAIMQEQITVKEWREKFMKGYLDSGLGMNQSNQNSLSDYAGYAYDAVWMYALALDKLQKEDPTSLSGLHNETIAKRLVHLLGATDFNGVSGRIQFRGRASRTSVVNIVQWYFDGSKINLNIVGTFEPNVSLKNPDPLAGTLFLNESAIVWLTPNHLRPKDGTSPPPLCLVEGFKNLLGIQDCEIAIVIANVMGFGLLGLILMAVFIRVYQKYQKELKHYKESDVQKFASKLDKWEIPRDRVVINRKLGEGAFGYVYGGEAHFSEDGWVAVAVKTLKVGSTSEEKLDFLSEAEVMKRFDHKNIVKLLGVCTKYEPVYTVMEFMLYGDLKTFLLARRHLVNDKVGEETNEISSKKLTLMALDVARALSYLAELKFVHRDVACRNTLVNASRVVKLGDFGMTRPMFENDYYRFNRKGMLPVRWMAPESLGLGIFTPSSDVWSYGVLLYEIITFGSFPFQGMSNSQVLEHVKAGNTLKIPSGVKPQLEGLIRSCWNTDHKKRPQVSEIVEFLANNPRLLTPCLDVPLSSVQIEDNGQGDLLLPESLRKFSLPFRNRTNSARSNESTQWSIRPTDRPPTWTYNGSAQLDSPTKLSPLPETGSDFNSWMETTEPLLNNTNTNNGKYVILQPVKAANSSTITDDYVTHDSNRDSLL